MCPQERRHGLEKWSPARRWWQYSGGRGRQIVISRLAWSTRASSRTESKATEKPCLEKPKKKKEKKKKLEKKNAGTNARVGKHRNGK